LWFLSSFCSQLGGRQKKKLLDRENSKYLCILVRCECCSVRALSGQRKEAAELVSTRREVKKTRGNVPNTLHGRSQELLELLHFGPGGLANLDTALVRHESREDLDAELLSLVLVGLVAVELVHDKLVSIGLGDLDDLRVHHLARAAPLREEVDEYGFATSATLGDHVIVICAVDKRNSLGGGGTLRAHREGVVTSSEQDVVIYFQVLE